MNLGQAVAVCLYEITSRSLATSGPPTSRCPNGPSPIRTGDRTNAAPPASTRDLELLAGLVEETMLAANYSPPEMRNANRHDLNLLLRRLSLTRSDAGRILGFFRRILWRLKRNSNSEINQIANMANRSTDLASNSARGLFFWAAVASNLAKVAL